MKNLSCRLLLGAGRVDYRCIITGTCKMVLSRAALPFILTLDNALFALRPCAGRVDLLLPTGCPAKAASAANPPPEALLDAPVQIHTDCTNAMRARFEPDPLAFRAEWI